MTRRNKKQENIVKSIRKKKPNSVLLVEQVSEAVMVSAPLETVRSESGIKRLGRWFIVIAIGLLPLLFIPGMLEVGSVFQQTVTGLLFFAGLVCYLIDAFRARDFSAMKINFPVSAALIIFTLLFGASLYSSPSLNSSFWGVTGAETTSGISILIVLVGFLLAIVFFREKEDILMVFKAFLASVSVVFLVSIVWRTISLFFNSGFLGFNRNISLFFSTPSELGVFFGLSLILFFGIGIFSYLSVRNKLSFWLISVISLGGFIFTATNSIFGSFIFIALASLLLGRVLNKEKATISAPLPFIVFSLAVICVLVITGYRPANLLQFLPEAIPNISSSFSIARQSVSANWQSFLLGTGPNTFGLNYAAFKPPEINLSQFWNIDFNSGFSFWLTLLPSVGVLATISLFFAFLMILRRGFIFSLEDENKDIEIKKIIAITASYLFIASLFHNFSFVLITYLFFVLGLLISYQKIELSGFGGYFSESRYQPFISSVVLIGTLVLVLLLVIPISQRLFVSFNIQYIIADYNQTNNTEKSIEDSTSVFKIFPQENLARIVSVLWLRRMNELLSSKEPDISKIQESFNNAISFSDQAIIINPSNYENWRIKGDIYKEIIPSQEAADKAIESYRQAERLNPTNPALPLVIGQLQFFNAQSASTSIRDQLISEAEESINRSIEIKPNFTDAIMILGQFYQNQGNLDKAAEYFEQALSIDQSDNARYLLASVYEQLGKINEAEKLFQEILKTNPDNQYVSKKINDLKSEEEKEKKKTEN